MDKGDIANEFLTADKLENIPLDAKLLSYAIIELNISRRNVAIYPRDHPTVERTLDNAFKFLKQLFEIRPQITLAVAKDTIIIDKYHLEKKNPVFKDFALTLSKMNIAYVTLKIGITKDELYGFHRFITEKQDDLTINNLGEILKKYKVPHIDVGFIDYQKFTTRNLKPGQHTQKVPIWERYIYGLIEGTLKGEEVYDEVREIPPEILASLLNKVSGQAYKEEAYDKIITAYMRSSSDNIFSAQDLNRLLDFIARLRPDLKNRFLSSAVKTFSEDTASTYQSLKNMSVDAIEGFLEAVNKQRIVIPPALRSLIDNFSYDAQESSDAIYLEEDLMENEDILSSSLAELFDEKEEKAVLSEDIQEIQNLVDFDATDLKVSHLMEFDNEFNEELTEIKFNQVILELMLTKILSESEYQLFVDTLKGQSQQLIWTGQYEQLLVAFRILESNIQRKHFPDITSKALQYYHSPDFILLLTDSFNLLGRQLRKEVLAICAYYDQEIIPYLLDALVEEESQIIRRFLMGLLQQFGHKIIPETVKRLHDNRWFVKRNMLYILRDLDVQQVSEYIRPCCRDENPKVSLIALKCLLHVKDVFAIETIRQHLASDSQSMFDQAVTLAGSFKIKEVVPDLIGQLNKQEISGTDIYKKLSIIRALGDIADPQVLGALRELLSRRSLFFRKITEQLKEEIYKTFKNYPYELVKDLVTAGVESKNNVIREESLRLRNENAQ